MINYFRIRFNSELCELLYDIGVVQRTYIQQLHMGSAMLFVWRRMLRRDRYLMWGSVEVDEKPDIVSVEGPNLGSLIIDWRDQLA